MTLCRGRDAMAEKPKNNSRKISNNPPRALRTILLSLKKYRFLGVLTVVTILVEAAMQIEIPTVMSVSYTHLTLPTKRIV